jgi:hypothetical protein
MGRELSLIPRGFELQRTVLLWTPVALALVRDQSGSK